VRERCKNDKLVKPRVTPVSAFPHKGDSGACVCDIIISYGARNTRQTYKYIISIYVLYPYSNLSIILCVYIYVCVDRYAFFIQFFFVQFEDRSRLSFSFHG